MANTFKFGNGNWAVKDGYALAYNDENGNFKPLPFDFTRASSATRVNKDGLIETVPSGKPRIDFTDNTSGHLLLEPSRMNVMTDSELSTSTIVTHGDGVSSDITLSNGLSGKKLSITSSGRSFLQLNASVSSGVEYTFSAFVENFTGDSVSNFVDITTGGGGEDFSSDLIDNGKIEVSFTTTSTSVQIRVGIGCTTTLSGARSAEISGVQLEAGSYATSYIPTRGLSETRSAEYAIDAGNSTVFSDTELSWFLDIEGLAEDGTSRYISISDGGGSPFTNGYAVQYRNDGQLRIFRNGLDFADAICIVDIDQTIRQKIAIRYKQNDMKVYINGVSQSLNGSYVFQSMSGVDRMKTNQQDSATGSNAFDGKIYEMKVWNEALSDSELQALTS